LLALGFAPSDITGIDLRVERALEAKEKYNIKVIAGTKRDLEDFLKEGVNALIISVPPDQHCLYMDLAIRYHVPAFVEASVVDTGLATAIKASKDEGNLIVPSSTMRFHPAIRLVKEIVESGDLGTISNILYHMGQWLPDWHTYESPADYYVSNPVTSASREMVPFELTWLTWVFGSPTSVVGMHGKTVDIPGANDIDDTYNVLLEWEGVFGVLTIDVVSRHAVRRLLVNGSKKQLIWDWEDKCVKIFDPVKKRWDSRDYDVGNAAAGYNTNIGERMYVAELANFLSAIEGKAEPANTLEADLAVLNLLKLIERSCRDGRIFEVIPDE
jgi:predicted dehydrogenase